MSSHLTLWISQFSRVDRRRAESVGISAQLGWWSTGIVFADYTIRDPLVGIDSRPLRVWSEAEDYNLCWLFVVRGTMM